MLSQSKKIYVTVKYVFGGRQVVESKFKFFKSTKYKRHLVDTYENITLNCPQNLFLGGAKVIVKTNGNIIRKYRVKRYIIFMHKIFKFITIYVYKAAIYI